jgi:GntR family transcriptional regulator
MLLNLTDISDEPLQSQILAGEMSAGEVLPSIRALARETRVSVITVQRGYEALEREGLIHSRRGKGFFVSEIRDNRKKEMAEERLSDQLSRILADAFSEGMTPEEITAVFGRVLKARGGQVRE